MEGETNESVGARENVAARLRQFFAVLKAKRERKDISELMALKTNLE